VTSNDKIIQFVNLTFDVSLELFNNHLSSSLSYNHVTMVVLENQTACMHVYVNGHYFTRNSLLEIYTASKINSIVLV